MLKTYQFKTHCKGASGIQIHSTALCWLKQLISPKLNTIYDISLADVMRSPLFYHKSWQNDICSFRAMTVALTVSFKLSF